MYVSRPDGVTALSDFLHAARAITRRVEWRDAGDGVSALLVSCGDDVLAYWMRHPFDESDVSATGGSTLIKDIGIDDVETFRTPGMHVDGGDPLDDVLPRAGGDAMSRLLGLTGHAAAMGDPGLRSVAALALAPSHGMLRRRFGHLLTRATPDAPPADPVDQTVEDRVRIDGWRGQASWRYPTFATALATGDVDAAIVAGRPFEADLARILPSLHDAPDALGAPTPSALRRIRGVALHPIEASDAVWCMGTLPAERLPSHVRDWRVLCSVARAYRATGLPAGEAAGRLRGAWRDWASYSRNLEADGLCGADRFGAPTDPLHVPAVLAHIDATLVTPMARRLGLAKSDPGVARHLAFGDAGFRNVLILARRQLLASKIIDHALPNTFFESAWPALLPDTAVPGGLHVICLDDGAKLHDEEIGGSGGRGLLNGARGLAPDCLAGKLHLLSIRDPSRLDRARIATVGVVVAGPGHQPKVDCVLGHLGGNDMARCMAAIDFVLAQVAAGKLALDPGAVDRSRLVRGLPDPAGRPGDAAMTRAIDVWRPFLARRHRRIDIQGLQDMVVRAATSQPL